MKNKKRKLQYIRLKNQMMGKTFHTHDHLHDNSQWADIYFFGKNKDIYNATIMTLACHWNDVLEEKAWEDINALTEGIELYSFKDGFINSPSLPQLGGLGPTEYLEAKIEEIATDNPPEAFAHFQLLKGYTYGIGLNMVIDTPCLSEDIVSQAIEKFIALGEKDWKSTTGKIFDYRRDSNFSVNAISL